MEITCLCHPMFFEPQFELTSLIMHINNITVLKVMSYHFRSWNSTTSCVVIRIFLLCFVKICAFCRTTLFVANKTKNSFLIILVSNGKYINVLLIWSTFQNNMRSRRPIFHLLLYEVFWIPTMIGLDNPNVIGSTMFPHLYCSL